MARVCRWQRKGKCLGKRASHKGAKKVCYTTKKRRGRK